MYGAMSRNILSASSALEIEEYVNAESLQVGQKLVFKQEGYELNHIQEQILIGKMLGDASYSKNHISFGQKIEHEEYLDYTLDSLGDIGGNRHKNQTSGFGTEMVKGITVSCNDITDKFADWFSSIDKQVPATVISKLSPISAKRICGLV